jgi:hypothetical protein
MDNGLGLEKCKGLWKKWTQSTLTALSHVRGVRTRRAANLVAREKYSNLCFKRNSAAWPSRVQGGTRGGPGGARGPRGGTVSDFIDQAFCKYGALTTV